MNRPPFLVLALAGATLTAPAGGLQAEPPHLDALVQALVESRGADAATRRGLRAELMHLGPGATDAIFSLIAGRSSPEVELDGPLIDREATAFLYDVLRSWRPAEVGSRLTALVDRGSPFADHLIALDLVGEAGDFGAYAALLATYGEPGLEWVTAPSLQTRLEESLEALLERRAGSTQQLRAVLDEAPAHVLMGPAQALSQAGTGQASSLLTELLGREAQLDLLVLKGMGARDPRDPDGDVRRMYRLRRYLDHEDPRYRRQAIASLARLQDGESFGDVLDALEDDDRGVRGTALNALRGLSGLAWPAEPDRWHVWYERELRWFHEQVPGLIEDLHDGQPGPALRALRELGAHPLFGRELSPDIRLALDSPTGTVAAAASQALERLGALDAVEDLERMVDDPDPAVAGAAGRALRVLLEGYGPAAR